MIGLSVKHKIVLGLLCLMVSAILLTYFAGLGPNHRAATMQGRAQLCEATAVATSMLTNDPSPRRIEKFLSDLVDRNEDIVSAGLIRESGKEIVDINSHFASQNEASDYSTETFVRVPLRRGGQKWAELQIRFYPIDPPGLIGWLLSPMSVFVVVISLSCFLTFSFFLGRVLQQLDPSNAVPRRVRTALDTLTEGLIVTDRKGRLILANEAFARWIGQPAESLAGKRSERFSWELSQQRLDGSGFARDSREASHLPWQSALDEEKPVAGRLLHLTDVNGKRLTLVANASPVLGSEGQYRGVLTSFEDVTDLERHKVELSEAKLEADRANQAKSEFLARMSHEIRTPMNAILGYTEVLQFGIEDDPHKRAKHLNTIQSSGEHLLALINDILDLSKIESGQLELELDRVSVHELILQVLSVLKIRADEKGIGLEYKPKGPMPKTILTDGVRLKQAIINLVGNAIKFTEQGGVLVQPQLIDVGGKTMLNIVVADTGIGMSAEVMSRIFNPFSQADTSITRRFGGTGLGLSICKELADRLGGSVTVTSELGKGSEFAFQIDPGDLRGIELVDCGELVAMEVEQTLDRKQFRMEDARVLIVDDGESNRELVALFLKRAGIQFVQAVNGQEAVAMVQAEPFDAVLMDMQMPVMDGFTATATLRELGYQLPIIALTANAMAQDERRCRESGCSGFLPKPIKRDRLYRELELALPQIQVSYKTIEPTTKPDTQIAHPNSESAGAPGSVHSRKLGKDDQVSFEVIESSLPMEDEDFVVIAKMFHAQLELKLESMRRAAQQKDFSELFNLGHWLKGAGGSAGFDDFNDPGKQLETAARNHDLDRVVSLIANIRGLSQRMRIPEVQAKIGSAQDSQANDPPSNAAGIEIFKRPSAEMSHVS